MKNIIKLFLFFGLVNVVTTPIFSQEAELKAALTKAETAFADHLTGSRQCPTATTNDLTDHTVIFSWVPGSKRHVKIGVKARRYENNVMKYDISETYEFDLVSTDTSNITGAEPDSQGNLKITGPSILKISREGARTSSTTAFIKNPCKPGTIAGTFTFKVSELNKAAKAFWVWARDRG